MERQNETLQENLIKYRQEHRVLLDKVNILQQQLTQVSKTTTQQQLLSWTKQYSKVKFVLDCRLFGALRVDLRVLLEVWMTNKSKYNHNKS